MATTAPTAIELAQRIRAALRLRHSGGLYGEEVLCGPGGSIRLDAWAMPRSWAHWETIGYEIKVTRADWVRDSKLETYRHYVHRLWIVCPWGLIKPEEVTDGCGLLWVTMNGDSAAPRAVAKLKAVRGNPEKWEKPLLSLMINRGSIRDSDTSTMPQSDQARREVCAKYLEAEELDGRLGWQIGQKLGQQTRKLKEWQRSLESRERQIDQYDQFKEAAAAAGYYDPLRVFTRIKELEQAAGAAGLDTRSIHEIRGIEATLVRVVNSLKQMRGATDGDTQ